MSDFSPAFATKLRDRDGLWYYFKVTGQLDNGTLDRFVATALELGSNPGAYFTQLVKNELAK